MLTSKPKRWQKAVLEFFDKSPVRVFRRKDLADLLDLHQEDWGLPTHHSISKFVPFLEDSGKLRSITLSSESGLYSPINRYVWGQASSLQVALSLRPSSYFTHATAVFLHGLIQQLAKTVYVNKEQSPKRAPPGSLTQEALDRAFANEQRTSRYIFSYEDARVVLVSGKYTNRLEVCDVAGPNGEISPVTRLERTLIDIVVRPAYAGGANEVLKVYQRVKEREISVDTLIATLSQLGYLYPYHQAIGFYMERAGFSPSHLDRLRKLGLNFDFYLANAIKERKYDRSWRLFFPEGL
ncbi:MAG TPA: hypothetical protein VF962_12855 [Gemmatimonadaceae bacterium]